MYSINDTKTRSKLGLAKVTACCCIAIDAGVHDAAFCGNTGGCANRVRHSLIKPNGITVMALMHSSFIFITQASIHTQAVVDAVVILYVGRVVENIQGDGSCNLNLSRCRVAEEHIG